MLRDATQDGKKVILVIGGGDGSVMSVISELAIYEIDHLLVPIAMIPLGTGNDFSQVLGWGKSGPSDLLSNNFNKLKKKVKEWLFAH